MGMTSDGSRNSEQLVSYCSFEDVLPLIEMRKTPSLPVKPKTVIVCLFPYHTGEYPDRNVARYAMLNDYHKICGEQLASFAAELKAAFPDAEFVPFIDSSPIREVHAARLAGLGVIGRHGMLIHEAYGSRVFIGTITTGESPDTFRSLFSAIDESNARTGLKLDTTGESPETFRSLFSAIDESNARYESASENQTHAAQTCLDCGKCIDACPTGAISWDKPLDRTLCRSAITQKKSALTSWEREQIKAGGFAWGCDICADICPMNQNAKKTQIDAFYEDIAPILTTDNLARLIKTKPYGWRGEAVLLRNLSILEES